MANRIHIKGEGMIYDEKNAGASGILPGMLLKLDSSDEVVIHADEGGRGELMVALEDSLQGHGVSDTYTDGNPVRVWLPRTGDQFYGLLEDGQDVVIGQQLISAGNGKFKASSDITSGDTVDHVFAVAMEAKDLTVSASVDTLVKMRAL